LHRKTSRPARWLRWTRMAWHAAMAAMLLRFVFPRTRSATHRRILQWWSEKLLRVLAVEPRVEGTPPGADAAVMIAANHVSWLDIFLISSVRPTRFIAKSEIRDWPFVGWVVEKAGTLFVRRAGRRDLARITERAHAALAEGDCVGLFPEGTTTAGDTLLKFHSSLFEPAIANGARIYPVAIRYEHEDGTLCRAASFAGEISFMQSLGLIARQHRIVARVSFAPPIEPDGAARREVARRAQERVASLLGLPVADTAPGTPPGPPAGSP
jgi:1-acyl-sn-glycerol-3-phosphate acyltransferase